MSWARLELATRLERGQSLPDDVWVQTDIWMPNLDPCNLGNTPFFLMNGTGNLPFDYIGFGAGSWNTNDGSSTTDPLTPATPFTVGFHRTPHGSGPTFYAYDWYVNGVLIISDPAIYTAIVAPNLVTLNAIPPFCCCQTVYYTNVLFGTSQGAGDLFSDDFSGGITVGPGETGNWTVNSYYVNAPVLAAVVTAPSSDPCPTVTANRNDAQVGTPLTVTGAGFAPGSDITVYGSGISVGPNPIESVSIVTDGDGNFTNTFEIPYGLGSGTSGFTLYFVDSTGLMACLQLGLCGGARADGIRAEVDSEGSNTDTPTPLVAYGGASTGSPNAVLDYIWHDGAHWVLWQDPSSIDNASTFNPIPANHTLNATRISADGSSVTDYPINTGYRFSLDHPANALTFLSQNTKCCPPFHDPPCIHDPTIVTDIFWDRVWNFDGWSKPIYAAQFASDGTNLWVGVLTRESTDYPYPSADQEYAAFGMDALQAGDPEGFTYQTTRPSHDPGSIYDPVIRFSIGIPDDFCYHEAFPTSDNGDAESSFWDPPRVRMFCFDGSVFNDIGRMDANYCPGGHTGIDDVCYAVQNAAGNGSFFSGISLAASPAEPGICHLVWSEGGDWGTYGLGSDDASGCPCPLTWDGGPLSRDYRVGYCRWSPTAKIFETDLWHSHIDRGLSPYLGAGPAFWYDGEFGLTGYTWPPNELFAATNLHALRNDSGRPLLFLSWLETVQDFDESGDQDYTIIGGSPVLGVYDLSGVTGPGSGGPALLQQLDVSLLPNATEIGSVYFGESALASNVLNIDFEFTSNPTEYFPGVNSESLLIDSGAICTFGISDIYNDPLLGGTPVYLLHVPWAFSGPTIGEGVRLGFEPLRGFYRIPVDMSDTFDFLDGTRQFDFTIMPPTEGGAPLQGDFFGNASFFSDPRNIWFPATSLGSELGNFRLGAWFDRICSGRWQDIRQAETPGDFLDITDYLVGYSMCPGFYYDPVADSISMVAPLGGSEATSGNLFAVVTVYLCRECRTCQCGTGVHIAHRT